MDPAAAGRRAKRRKPARGPQPGRRVLEPVLVIDLKSNWSRVRGRIAAAAARAGREAGSVTLVAVTKSAPAAAARSLHALGQIDLGENRVQDGLAKIAALGPGPIWHLIGHLQSNKVRKAAGAFPWIHSVDSTELLRRLDRAVRDMATPAPNVFVQVNVTGEERKHGWPPEAVREALHAAARLTAVQVVGLMTMARYDPDPEASRPTYRALAELRREAEAAGWYRAPLPHLSMGMSGDFEVAVEEGATHVRVGSALFDPQTA